MIQRIQSIFLLISAICIGVLYNFPFASSDKAAGTFLADKSYDLLDSNFLLVFAGLSLVLSLVTLFMFKNRSLQLRLSVFTIIAIILFIILIIFLFYQEFIGNQSNVIIEDGIGLYLPIVALVFAFLANKFIKKDDKKVRSMDRLR